MTKPASIRVRAAAGRLVAFPARVLAAPGAEPLRLHGAGVLAPDHPGDDPVDAPDHPFTRKRLNVGDLLREPVAAIVKSPNAAAPAAVTAATPSSTKETP